MTDVGPGATLYGWASKHQSQPTEYVVLRRTGERAIVRLSKNEQADELTVDLVERCFVPDTGESLHITPENPFGRAVAQPKLHRGLLNGQEVSEPGRYVVVNPHTGDRPYSSDQEALARAAADRLSAEIRGLHGPDAAPAQVFAHREDTWLPVGGAPAVESPVVPAGDSRTEDNPTVEDVIAARRLAALARLEEAAKTIQSATAALNAPQTTDLRRCVSASEKVTEARQQLEAAVRLLDSAEDLGRLFGMS